MHKINQIKIYKQVLLFLTSLALHHVSCSSHNKMAMKPSGNDLQGEPNLSPTRSCREETEKNLRALHQAIKTLDVKQVELLLTPGNVNSPCPTTGNTTAHAYAKAFYQYGKDSVKKISVEKILKLLKSTGVDLNQKNHRGQLAAELMLGPSDDDSGSPTEVWAGIFSCLGQKDAIAVRETYKRFWNIIDGCYFSIERPFMIDLNFKYESLKDELRDTVAKSTLPYLGGFVRPNADVAPEDLLTTCAILGNKLTSLKINFNGVQPRVDAGSKLVETFYQLNALIELELEDINLDTLNCSMDDLVSTMNHGLKKLRIFPRDSSLTDRNVKAIVQKFKNLTELALPNKHDGRITDRGAKAIARRKQLRKLDLEGNRITSRGLHCLLDNLPHLTWINLGGNYGLSKIVEGLKVRYPNIIFEVNSYDRTDNEMKNERVSESEDEEESMDEGESEVEEESTDGNESENEG